MNWRRLLEPDIQEFMRRHVDADVPALALKKQPASDWPYALVLDQIKVRQKAKIKSPHWYETNGIIFPSSDIFEQSSSYACATYKARLVEGKNFVDLTTGSGADSYGFLNSFSEGILVDCDENNIELLRHNFNVLGFENEVSFYHGRAEEFIKGMNNIDLVYIDPQRRGSGRKGLYEFSECSPDVTALLPVLMKKAGAVMLKASPVMDIHKAVATLKMVREVHVIGWQGDCKEVLYMLDFNATESDQEVRIIAVELDAEGQVLKRFAFKIGEEESASVHYALPMKYIHEPSSSFQKAGGFKSMAVQYGLAKLHPSTHLYTSNDVQEDFCGKSYEIVGVFSAGKNDLPVRQAEISLRNYPGSIEAIRKKLRISEGGDHRIFAVTLMDGEKRLILCRK